MRRLVVTLLAVSTLGSFGCAAMGTKRPTGQTSIQRTAEPAQTIDNGSPFDSRPELGQR
jgi:hypothetical protein